MLVGAGGRRIVGADTGLGYLIQTSDGFLPTPVAFGAVVILAIMGTRCSSWSKLPNACPCRGRAIWKQLKRRR